MIENPYLGEIRVNLPRILGLFDWDSTSVSYGMGDRYHWAWGLIDFANGTFQGAAHGMAQLWRAGLWPYPIPPKHFLARMDAMFKAVKKMTREDGSLEESFPREGSYCVTALVAYDLLCAIDLLGGEIPKHREQRWRAFIAPMVDYLIKADETHAFISNHLATAVAALLRWHRLTGDAGAERKALTLLDKILSHQSAEGWFKEYEGADPGYQSLCTYYMADAHLKRQDLSLLEPLRRSIRFLWHFAHPDGSFGGLYGSRCTRFYYPAGVMALAKEIPEAAALARFMEKSIAQNKVVTLSSMDEPNLIPMFNAYARAAVLRKEQQRVKNFNTQALRLPCQERRLTRKQYPQAGLWLDRGPTHFTIVSTHKGGVVYHFRKAHPPLINAGVVVQNAHGRLGSTQAINPQNIVQQKAAKLEITSQTAAMPKQLPGPLQFIFLRLLSVTVFGSARIREWIKRRLVTMLVTRRKAWPVRNHRRIHLGAKLKIKDQTVLAPGYRIVKNVDDFVSFHMASQGYWQVQDEEGRK